MIRIEIFKIWILQLKLSNMVDFHFAMFSTNSNHQGLQFLSNWDTITREFFNNNYVVGYRPF